MISNRWLKIIAWAAGLIGAAAALFIISILYIPVIKPILQVILPFSIAVALALLLDPVIDKIQRIGLSRGMAIGSVIILFLTVFVIISIFLVPVVVEQAKELGTNLPGYYREVQSRLNSSLADNESLLRKFKLPTTMQELTFKFSSQIQIAAKTAVARGGEVLGKVISKSIWLVIIPIITVFLLIDIDKIKAKALILVPVTQRDRTAELAGSVGQVFGAYIRGLISTALLYGTACGVAMALWGVPYAVMLGAAAGVLSLVPYVGAISTVLLVGLVAFVNSPASPLHALYVAGTILILNQIFDNLISPKIVGKAVGLHPALSILALLIGGQLFGFAGMILSVPVAASIQIIILEFYPELKGPDKPEKPRKLSLWTRMTTRKPKATKESAEQVPDSSGNR